MLPPRIWRQHACNTATWDPTRTHLDIVAANNISTLHILWHFACRTKQNKVDGFVWIWRQGIENRNCSCVICVTAINPLYERCSEQTGLFHVSSIWCNLPVPILLVIGLKSSTTTITLLTSDSTCLDIHCETASSKVTNPFFCSPCIVHIYFKPRHRPQGQIQIVRSWLWQNSFANNEFLWHPRSNDVHWCRCSGIVLELWFRFSWRLHDVHGLLMCMDMLWHASMHSPRLINYEYKCTIPIIIPYHIIPI